MVLFKSVLFLVLLHVGCESSFVFKLAEDYAVKFHSSMENFKKLSRQFHHEEDHFLRETYKILNEEEVYDFIIIGGGTSGAVLANRLSEVPEWKILLLEAGAEESEITKIPAMQPFLQTTPYNWGFKTIPQHTSCLGMEEDSCSIPMGRAIGGSSTINDMVFTRGNPRDYDVWADKGLLGWCWESVLPYFKKMEDVHIKDVDKKYHHLGGPLYLENFQFSLDDLSEYILEAAAKFGFKKVDYNGKEQIGFGYPQVITKEGKRHSTADAYLIPIQHRKNLIIKPLSHAIKILINHHTREAIGVEYLQHGELLIAKATKEVVLAAGAINTPKLLTLSGIGSKDDLDKHDIEPIVYLKVGNHLSDHMSFIGLNFVYNETLADEEDPYHEVLDYLKHGKGPLTTNQIELLGFLKSDPLNTYLTHPDIEFLVSNHIYNKGYDHVRSMRFKKEIYWSVWKPLEGRQGFTINVVLTHPRSRGLVRLSDLDPLHYPLIHLNALSDDEDHDIETLLSGIKLALALVETTILQDLGIHLHYHNIPACGHLLFRSDEYWRCVIRHLTVSMGHVTGTAKMGLETDKEAVVDHHLKVFGVHKLRVADASVIPVGITGHVMGPTLMIGEKASDLIKEEWLF